MSKSRTMGACNAGASQFIALNGNQGGGSKKQGLHSTVGRISGIDYNRSYGNNQDIVFHINQLGGVGKGRSMFSSNADGVSKSVNIDTSQIVPEPELEQPPQFGSGASNAPEPLNDGTIAQAVTKWIANRTQPMFTDETSTPYYGPIQDWDTSQVTNMSNLFQNKNTFNDDISNWDVSKVTNMSYMFNYASVFAQSLSSWDVSNVTDMSYMFSAAKKFNGNINSWDVSKVTNIINMFGGASVFAQSLSSWNVGNIGATTNMFYGAAKFNGDISAWDVSKVTNTAQMFMNASVFDHPIRGWNTLSVTRYDNMFSGASAMISTYTNTPGFAITPNATFFNQNE